MHHCLNIIIFSICDIFQIKGHSEWFVQMVVFLLHEKLVKVGVIHFTILL